MKMRTSWMLLILGYTSRPLSCRSGTTRPTVTCGSGSFWAPGTTTSICSKPSSRTLLSCPPHWASGHHHNPTPDLEKQLIPTTWILVTLIANQCGQSSGLRGMWSCPGHAGKNASFDLSTCCCHFYQMGFLSCVETINSTHISILCLSQSINELINWKGLLSIMMQDVVNHHGCFTHIIAGWVAKTSSLEHWGISANYLLVKNRCWAPEVSIVVVPPIIIRDPTYPLFP